MTLRAHEKSDADSVTVIIPTYNRQPWLREAVESVLADSHVPLVLHIFDNASTDGTEDYVRTLVRADKRVRYTRQEANLGSLRNYDQAFQHLNSAFFLPLADDDLLFPEFLYGAYEIIRSSPDLGAVIFQTRHENDERVALGVNPSHDRQMGRLEPADHIKDWMKHGHYQWSSILWNTDVVKTIGRPRLEVGLPNDVDFQAQAFCRFPVYRVARLGAVYRMHPNQESLGVLSGNWREIITLLDLTMKVGKTLPWNDYLCCREVLLRRWKVLWKIILWKKPWGIVLRAAWNLGVKFHDYRFAISVIAQKLSLVPGIDWLRSKLALRTRLRRLIPT